MGEDLLQTATVDLRSLWIERVGPLDETSVVDVADVLLMDLVSRRTSGITVVPTGPRHEISYVDADVQGSIRSDLADAVVARFGLIADLDVAGSLPQLGRIRARASSEQTKAVTEVLVAIRPTPAGLAAELRLLADPVAVAGEHRDEKVVAEGVQVGKYRLLQKIGTGGMGTVYRAEHVILQKPVAIKVLHGGAGAAFSDSQFLVEARAPCLVRHPSVVDVTDFGRLPDGRSFVVMELVELPTLAQSLARSGSLAPKRAVTLASRIAEALSVLHAHGVLHRDLKPANVFVDDEDGIKLCDFGVSTIMQGGEATLRHEESTAISGTPAYMSPEQAAGRSDARSDLYSLGCVLYEMLDGDPPYSGPSVLAVMQEHETAPIPTPVSRHGPLPAAVGDLLHRAMAKRPEERYQSAQEMLVALRSLLDVLQRRGWRRWLPI